MGIRLDPCWLYMGHKWSSHGHAGRHIFCMDTGPWDSPILGSWDSPIPEPRDSPRLVLYFPIYATLKFYGFVKETNAFQQLFRGLCTESHQQGSRPRSVDDRPSALAEYTTVSHMVGFTVTPFLVTSKWKAMFPRSAIVIVNSFKISKTPLKS